MTRGTIYADGRVQYLGYTRMDSWLVSIDRRGMVIRHAGGTFWNNAGRNYVAARIEGYALLQLRRGNEDGTWLFLLGNSLFRHFHPQKDESVRAALNTLHYQGDEIAVRLEGVQ